VRWISANIVLSLPASCGPKFPQAPINWHRSCRDRQRNYGANRGIGNLQSRLSSPRCTKAIRSAWESSHRGGGEKLAGYRCGAPCDVLSTVSMPARLMAAILSRCFWCCRQSLDRFSSQRFSIRDSEFRPFALRLIARSPRRNAKLWKFPQ